MNRRIPTQIPASALAILFLLVIYLPMVDQLFGLRLDQFATSEKRTLAARPALRLDSLASFPGKYEDYFDDNFSFRIPLIKLNSFFSSRVFDLSPRPDVVIGKEGWLYLTSEAYGNSLEDYLGLIDVDKGTLDLIRNNLEQRTQELASRGIQLRVVIAPDKQTIYPEFLPDRWQRKKERPTRLDQIVAHLQAKSWVQIIDVRAPMLKEKKSSKFPLYRKTDSHWNSFGAFIAYQQIMKSLSIEPMQMADFEWEMQTAAAGGDITDLLAAGDQYKEENDVSFSPLFEHEVTFEEFENNYNNSYKDNRLVATNKGRSQGKMLVFHDSFGSSLFKFLSCHFRETVFINCNQYSSAIIEKEKPDIVIFEVVERFSTSLSWKELE